MIRETAPADYQYYTQIFKYLEHRLGAKNLAENLRLAIQENDASQLYRELGILDDRWLYEAVDSWERQTVQQRFIIGLAILGALILGLYSSLPELVCECGYKGRKRDFPFGACPDCGRLVPGASNQPPQQPGYHLYPDCQICGRHFWPWQRDEIQIYKRWIRAWSENLTADQPPIAHYVYRICQSCLHQSQVLVENYQNVVDAQIGIFRETYRPVYQQWLSSAPMLPDTISTAVDFPAEVFIDQLLWALLVPYYNEWMTTRPRSALPTSKITLVIIQPTFYRH